MGKVLHASYSGYFPGCLKKVEQVERKPDPKPMPLRGAMDLYWRVSHWDVKVIPSFESSYTFNKIPIKHRKKSSDPFEAITNESDLVCTEFANLQDLAIIDDETLNGYFVNLYMGKVGGISNGYFGEYTNDAATNFTPNFYGVVSWLYFTGGFAGSLLKSNIIATDPVGKMRIFFDYGVYTSTLYGYGPDFNPEGRQIDAELTPSSYRSFGGTWN